MNSVMHEAVPAVDVCALSDLMPEVGVRVLVNDQQVALILMQTGELFAISAVDPFSQAAVLSRGVVGDIGGEPVVASPIYKHHFRLIDGLCIEDDTVRIPIFAVSVVESIVRVDPIPKRVS